MRIISWNVNGLRALLSKGVLNQVLDLSPDILSLQEIKVRKDQLTHQQLHEFQGFQGFWNSAERPGYSGVVNFCKIQPESVDPSLGEDRFDKEGRSIRLDYGNLALFNLYVPNGQRDQGRLNYKLDFYARLLELCDDLHENDKQVILYGDMNTAHKPIDLRHSKQNEKTSGFLPEERAWIDEYLRHGFVDIFRDLFPDKVQYTWWTYRLNARQRDIGWRLDYFLISKSLVEKVVNVEIYTDIMGSDHCPIGLEVENTKDSAY